MDLESLTPFPEHPLEIAAHILSFCDVQTLGRTLQASLAFLEISGPLLYQDITVRGKKQLEMMIRSENVLDTIAPFVSLAQTKTFTYTPDRRKAKSHDSSRLLVSTPAVLQELTIDLRKAQGTFESLDNILSSFDPSHLHILFAPGMCRDIHRFLLPDACPWPHLRRLTFVNGFNGLNLDRPCGRPVNRTPLLDIVYDLTGPDIPNFNLTSLLPGVCTILGCLGKFGRDTYPGHAYGHVQIWLNNEKEVAFANQLRSKLSGRISCTSLDIGVKQSGTV